MERVHNLNTNCEICKKMYRPSCSMKNHPREYVEPTELHQCPHCPFKSSKGQLISKGLFGVIVSTKKTTTMLNSPLLSKYYRRSLVLWKGTCARKAQKPVTLP